MALALAKLICLEFLVELYVKEISLLLAQSFGVTVYLDKLSPMIDFSHYLLIYHGHSFASH